MSNARPSFQFYPRDFLADTTDMTAEEVGAYWLILSRAWLTSDRPGHLPNDSVQLARIARISLKRWSACSKAIMSALKVTDDGEWVYSKRMVEEWKKQTSHKEEASEAGKKGAAARWGAHAVAMATPSISHGDPNATAMAKNDSASASASADLKSLSRAPAHVDWLAEQQSWGKAWKAAGFDSSPSMTAVVTEWYGTPEDRRPSRESICLAYAKWLEAMRATNRYPRSNPQSMVENWVIVLDIARGKVKSEAIAAGAKVQARASADVDHRTRPKLFTPKYQDKP